MKTQWLMHATELPPFPEHLTRMNVEILNYGPAIRASQASKFWEHLCGDIGHPSQRLLQVGSKVEMVD